MRKSRILLRTAILFLAVFIISVPAAQAEIRAVELDKPEALPAFNLKDHTGKPFTAESLHGRWTLSVLGFTHCPDVCPFVLSNLAAVLTEMATWVRPDNLPNLVFVAVDPARDADLLGDYVKHFDPRILGVTGEHAELAKFVEGIDGFYRLMKPEAEGVYDIQHSASIIVTAPDGRVHVKLSPPLAPKEVAQYLARKQIVFRRSQTDK